MILISSSICRHGQVFQLFSKILLPPILCGNVVPWMHVGLFFVGAWAGNKYVQVEEQLVKDINEIRADRGLPPLAGTSSWVLRYTTATDSVTSDKGHV